MAKILVVDDDEQVRKMLKVVLWTAGHEVQIANSAAAAMDKCREHNFDLVLSDVVMPELNGHALASWVAGHNPACRLALMTGYDSECDTCPYVGRCPILKKPFVVKEVLAFVGGILAAPPPGPVSQ